MSEIKTASEWFKELPRAIELKAINAKLHYPKKPHTELYLSLPEAIDGAFHWSATSEGQNYWAGVRLRVIDGDPKMERKKLKPRLQKGEHEYTVSIELRTVHISGIKAKSHTEAKKLAKEALFNETGITENHISTLTQIRTK